MTGEGAEGFETCHTSEDCPFRTAADRRRLGAARATCDARSGWWAVGARGRRWAWAGPARIKAGDRAPSTLSRICSDSAVPVIAVSARDGAELLLFPASQPPAVCMAVKAL